jgi:hypothetical protein
MTWTRLPGINRPNIDARVDANTVEKISLQSHRGRATWNFCALYGSVVKFSSSKRHDTECPQCGRCLDRNRGLSGIRIDEVIKHRRWRAVPQDNKINGSTHPPQPAAFMAKYFEMIYSGLHFLSTISCSHRSMGAKPHLLPVTRRRKPCVVEP